MEPMGTYRTLQLQKTKDWTRFKKSVSTLSLDSHQDHCNYKPAVLQLASSCPCSRASKSDLSLIGSEFQGCPLCEVAYTVQVFTVAS